MLSGVNATLERKVADLPDGPGVYQFLDARSRVIYVGKAKSLRRRVGSYFDLRAESPERTRALVAEIRDVEILVVATEIEALVLENSLIKKNKPRYNVRLRDDKNFPYIRLVTSDPVPWMEIVRRPRRDDDAYFGPFVPASTARKTIRLLAQHFGVRSCKGPIEDKDHRACLFFHIDQCLAPCAGHCTDAEYASAVTDATAFLKGRTQPLVDRLQARMREESDAERFERAAHYRDLLRMLEKQAEAQRVASTGLEQQDAWGLHREGGNAFLVVAFVREGLLRGRREFALRDVGDMPDDDLLGNAVRQYYHSAAFFPDEVLLPFAISEAELTEAWLRQVAGRAARLVVPQRGDKVERVGWASENARQGFELKFSRGDAAKEAVERLGELLDLDGSPERIEAFDISNVQGSDVVASMVCFVSGEPSRRDYRTFKIEGLSGLPDDYASMREVVGRRYRRLVAEERELPDLVLVDGGPGQLAAAAEALAGAGLHDMPLASIAKREEIIHVRGRDEPLRLQRSDAALQLVQRLRDEAHRVAVGFHRRRRSARTIVSELDAVPGIGPHRRRLLLRRFGSVAGVRAASDAELVDAVGEKLARALRIVLGAAPEA